MGSGWIGSGSRSSSCPLEIMLRVNPSVPIKEMGLKEIWWSRGGSNS